MKSYLHPVISPKGDATTLPLPPNNSVLNVKQIKTEDYIVSIDLNLNDKYVLRLIEDKKANYLYVVECDDTQYRVSYIENKPHIEIAIPRKSVINKVKILPYVIVNERIEYQNPLANEFYDNCSFELTKGDVLVEFGGHKFDAVITYSIDNIFKVICNPDPSEKYVKYSLEDKIRIILPHHDFHIYKGIGEDENYSPMINSSIVLNSLLYALFRGEFDKEEKDTDENWKKTIRSVVESERLPQKYSLTDMDSYPELAQALLENVFSKLFNFINENPLVNYGTEEI